MIELLNNEYTIMNLIFILLLASIWIQIATTNTKILHHKEFIKCIIYSILLTVADILMNYAKGTNEVLFNIFHCGYLIWFTCTGFNFFLFACKMIEYNKVNKHRIDLLFIAPFLVTSIVELLDIDLELAAIFTISYTVLYFVALTKLLFYLSSKKSCSDKFKFLAFPTIPFVISNLHTFAPIIPISSSVVIAIYIIYTKCLHMLITTDPLTNINNRQHLFEILEKKMKNVSDNDKLCVFMIDINEFKYINDTYGHPEGDNCLIHIANSLKSVCNNISNKSFICRYGGDEFILVAEIKDECIDKIINILTESVSEYSENKEYNLSVSIGLSYYNKEIHVCPKDIIIDADNKLYEAKRIFHNEE